MEQREGGAYMHKPQGGAPGVSHQGNQSMSGWLESVARVKP